MATIYRFIVEGRGGSGGRSGGRASSTPSRRTTGRTVSIFGGPRGGVEHNRKMRAINPLLNKATGGLWEKGTRVGRAALGLVKRNTETGKISLSGPAIAILIAFTIQTVMKIHARNIEVANQTNARNYKAIENGNTQVHNMQNITENWWDGRINYNQNK